MIAMSPWKKMTNSVFNWEESYFGGYERVVYDHPSIFIPYSIKINLGDTHGTSWYIANKVMSIFLTKVIKHHFTRILLDKFKVKSVRGYIPSLDKRVAVINKNSLKKALDMVTASDADLSNLFIHYRKLILASTIEWELSKKDDETNTEAITKSMQKDFERCKEQKPYTWGSGGSVSGHLKDDTEFVNASQDHGDWHPTSSEMKDANNLVNMLDISFDPKEDRVENLKCGKMSAHKVAEIPAGNTHVYYRVEENMSTRPFSICILADESGSMRGENDERQNHLMKVLYTAFSQILPQDKMFIYGHSGESTPEIRIYHDKYNTTFAQTINSQMNNDYNENYDGPVIENIYERVRQQTSDNIIFLSISDGEPAGEDYGGPEAIKEMKRVIEKCKRDGFVTVGIGLQYHRVKEIYQYHTVIKKSDDLVKNVSSLVNRVVKTEFKD